MNLSPHIAGLRRVRALTRKEFLQVVRDPSSILIAIVLPLLLLFLFGYGLSLDADHIKIGVVLEDSGADGRRLAESFQHTHYFDAVVVRHRSEVENGVVEGTLRGMVIIPPDFSARLNAASSSGNLSRRPVVQVLSDGSEPNTAAFLESYAAGVVESWQRQRGMERGNLKAGEPAGGIDLRPRFWFNAELVSRNFLIPGCITMILAIIGTLLTALVVAREWERGTMESLLATPVRAGELLISKLLPYFLLGMGSLVVSTLAARYLFQTPLRGSLFALALVTAAFLLASLALGLFLSTAARNQFVAAQGSILLAFLPAAMLSGFIFEISSMPLALQEFTRLVPARYYVSALQTVFLAGDIWTVILPSTGVLLLMAGLLLLATLRKSAKRLD